MIDFNETRKFPFEIYLYLVDQFSYFELIFFKKGNGVNR